MIPLVHVGKISADFQTGDIEIGIGYAAHALARGQKPTLHLLRGKHFPRDFRLIGAVRQPQKELSPLVRGKNADAHGDFVRPFRVPYGAGNRFRLFRDLFDGGVHDGAKSAVDAGRAFAALLPRLLAPEHLFEASLALRLIRKGTPESGVGEKHAQFIVEHEHPRGHSV